MQKSWHPIADEVPDAGEEQDEHSQVSTNVYEDAKKKAQESSKDESLFTAIEHYVDFVI